MNDSEKSEENEQLRALCACVRELARAGQNQAGERLAIEAMGKFPHAAAPHNLLGVLLEKEGLHPAAMKHFRAAWALDPTYIPARQNLECFGTFFPRGQCAFELGDCVPETPDHDHLRKRDYDVPKRG